jgi:thiaminase
MTALTNGGFTQQQAQYILDKEKVVKDTPHRKLTVTDLTRLAGAKLITMEEYTSYLADIGYSQSDIQLLQKLYGFTS